MTPAALPRFAALAHDPAQLVQQAEAWQSVALAAMDKIAELHVEHGRLERRVSEMMDERERYARSIFRDAPMREQV